MPCIRSGKIIVEYVGTNENIADIFTKALAKILFSKQARRLVHYAEEEEKCNLARTKQTIRNGRNPWNFYVSRQQAEESRQLSLNEWGVYLECECGRAYPYDEDTQMWDGTCTAGHESSSHVHYLICSVCLVDLDLNWSWYVNARAPAVCSNVHCSNYNEITYVPAEESKGEE